MASSRNPATHDVNSIRNLKWSGGEKAVARRAFEHALGQQLEAVVREAKNRAARIKEPSELWDLEKFLSQRRQEIDRKYDYRYSVLPLVFANLLREGRLSEEDLRGLSQDKRDYIRREGARA
jgi:hypothetical protein